MANKEARARIRINRLLEDAGWRFFDDAQGPANIVLEPNVKITQHRLDDLGADFEKTTNGFVDFLLLDANGKPLIVLEAKSEDIHPLSAKEQARRYARSQNARFVILSNGNQHFLWDLEQGNPTVITRFPSPTGIRHHYGFTPDAERLASEQVGEDYIALTQMPGFAQEAGWKVEAERTSFIDRNKLRFLRPYQQRAIERVQEDARKGSTRFLFEMATGTGKTLTAAAIIKLFLKTGNARRVLFLVDRLELEVQADKAFKAYLKNDFTSVVYKEKRDDWRKADIVVTTVQSLLFNDKYSRFFSPTDFDLVISDEAHRSIGGNARAANRSWAASASIACWSRSPPSARARSSKSACSRLACSRMVRKSMEFMIRTDVTVRHHATRNAPPAQARACLPGLRRTNRTWSPDRMNNLRSGRTQPTSVRSPRIGRRVKCRRPTLTRPCPPSACPLSWEALASQPPTSFRSADKSRRRTNRRKAACGPVKGTRLPRVQLAP